MFTSMGTMYSNAMRELFAVVQKAHEEAEIGDSGNTRLDLKAASDPIKAALTTWARANNHVLIHCHAVQYLYNHGLKKVKNDPEEMFEAISDAVFGDLHSLECMDRTALRRRAVRLASDVGGAVRSTSEAIRAAEDRVIAAAVEYAATVPDGTTKHPIGFEEDDDVVPAGPIDLERMCACAGHMKVAIDAQDACGFDRDDHGPGDDEELLAEEQLVEAALAYERVRDEARKRKRGGE